MAGTINFAMTQQFDMDGAPLSGGFLYFFTAGTTTPQSAFQDFGLTIAHPNPIVLDASGRVPMFYLADGFIKIRLTDKNGVTVIAADQLLVIGPSTGGGGGGGSVDQTAILKTGDIKSKYQLGSIPEDGFVRCNGRTISKTGASGTERADDICQALFEYLWPFPNITLNVGKGASANADWLAGRQLNLPDLRGRIIAGLDDMGAPAAGRLTSAGLGGTTSGTVLGNVGGVQTRALTTAQIPSHTHTATAGGVSAQHTHTFAGTFVTGGVSANHSHGFTTGGASGDHTHVVSGTTDGQSTSHTHGFTAVLGGANIATVGPNTVGSPTPAVSNTATQNVDHTHSFSTTSGGQNANHTHSGATGLESGDHNHGVSISGNTGVNSADHVHGITVDVTGGGTAHSNIDPMMILTFYMKL